MSMRRGSTGFKTLAGFVAVAFAAVFLLSDALRAKESSAATMGLPEPAKVLRPSAAYELPVLKGIKVDVNNPLGLEFVIDGGDKSAVSKRDVAMLTNYFLAGVTMPGEDLWVNLSPYESDRIINDNLAQTDLGKDMLAQDYVLKQFMSSMTSPREDTGKSFWQETLEKVASELGTTNVPVNTFNKVWIVPGEAEVAEEGTMAVIASAKLKVMLDQDYLALNKANASTTVKAADDSVAKVNAITEDVVRAKILPMIEKEVNEGKNFAQIRQMYHALVLSTWFRQKMLNSFYQHYMNQSKAQGILANEKDAKAKIYKLYNEAFKKGVYDFMAKEKDLGTGKMISRHYFSGGVLNTPAEMNKVFKVGNSSLSSVISRIARAARGPLLIAAVVLGVTAMPKSTMAQTGEQDKTMPAFTEVKATTPFNKGDAVQKLIDSMEVLEAKKANSAVTTISPQDIVAYNKIFASPSWIDAEIRQLNDGTSLSLLELIGFLKVACTRLLPTITSDKKGQQALASLAKAVETVFDMADTPRINTQYRKSFGNDPLDVLAALNEMYAKDKVHGEVFVDLIKDRMPAESPAYGALVWVHGMNRSVSGVTSQPFGSVSGRETVTTMIIADNFLMQPKTYTVQFFPKSGMIRVKKVESGKEDVVLEVSAEKIASVVLRRSEVAGLLVALRTVEATELDAALVDAAVTDAMAAFDLTEDDLLDAASQMSGEISVVDNKKTAGSSVSQAVRNKFSKEDVAAYENVINNIDWQRGEIRILNANSEPAVLLSFLAVARDQLWPDIYDKLEDKVLSVLDYCKLGKVFEELYEQAVHDANEQTVGALRLLNEKYDGAFSDLLDIGAASSTLHSPVVRDQLLKKIDDAATLGGDMSKVVRDVVSRLAVSANTLAKNGTLQVLDFGFARIKYSQDMTFGAIASTINTLTVAANEDPAAVLHSLRLAVEQVYGAASSSVGNTDQLGGIDFAQIKVKAAQLTKSLEFAPFDVKTFGGFSFTVAAIKKATEQDLLAMVA